MEKVSKNSGCTITVMEQGPYIVEGVVPFNQQIITPNESGDSWDYTDGRNFKMETPSTSLCRCGASKNKPYCDGSHAHLEWDPTLTDTMRPILSEARLFEGEELIMADNEKYCVFARFCHPGGGAWRLTKESANPDAKKLAIRESMMCPGARLMSWSRDDNKINEPDFKQSLALLEDPEIDSSGGIWVKGGIEVKRENGDKYETRNRVVLCRCGESHNKPYCDGSHARIRWHDEL